MGYLNLKCLVGFQPVVPPLIPTIPYELPLSKLSKNQLATQGTRNWTLSLVWDCVIKAQLVVRKWDLLVSQLFDERDLPLLRLL